MRQTSEGLTTTWQEVTVMPKRTTKTPEQRFWPKIVQDGDCWRWIGAIQSQGYGNFWHSYERGHLRAHRYTYELLRVEIPAGLVLDHLCRNRWCCNPWHLEPVTDLVNAQRMPAAVREAAIIRPIECKHGHPLTEANTYVQKKTGFRYCRTCQDRRRREFLARRAAAA